MGAEILPQVSTTELVVEPNGSIPKTEQFTDEKDANGSGWGSAAQPTSWISADGKSVVLPPAPSAEQPRALTRRRTLYLVRIPRSVDDKLRNQIKAAELRLADSLKKRDTIRDAMQREKAIKGELLEKLKPIREKERSYRELIQGKRMELEPYLMSLNKFKSSFRGKGQDLCSSEEELNVKISELEFKLAHEINTLKEEKQIMREIKQLQSTRAQVRELQAEIMENLGPKEEIQQQCNSLSDDLDAIRKEHKQIRLEYEDIDREIEKVNKALEELRQQFEKAQTAQQEAFGILKELKQQENSKNDPFYQNKRDILAAKDLSAQKASDELETSCGKQMEEFFGRWNADAKFRSEYVKNNEASTIRRLETLDGRSLGPGEKPLQINDGVISAPLPKSVIDTAAASSQPTSTAVNHAKASHIPSQTPEVVERASISENLSGRLDSKIYEEPTFESTVKSSQKDVEDDAIQAAELKGKRRQEEMAKAKEAAERKKKRAEKAESKAQARAQKEAERKEKEKEKRARKRAAASNAESTEGTSAGENPAVDAEPSPEVVPEARKIKSTGEVQATQKPVQRKKPPVKNTKGLKSTLTQSVSKKAVGPFPLWTIIVVALFVLLMILVFLFLRA